MKFLLTVLIISIAISSWAQTVTAVDYVKTKPGEFDNFIGFLKQNWVVAREKAKEKGAIVSFQYTSNREDTAWDIILITEYKDEETYKSRKKIFQQIFKEYFPNGPIMVNGKRSKDMADIKMSKEIKKE